MTISPIVAELVSTDHHDITSRGRVYVVSNPRDCQNDDWGWLIGKWVRLDGRIVEVRGVESFRTFGVYPKGKPIGLLIREVAVEDTSITV